MILLAIIKKSISQERCPMRVSLTRQDNPEDDPDIVFQGIEDVFSWHVAKDEQEQIYATEHS